MSWVIVHVADHRVGSLANSEVLDMLASSMVQGITSLTVVNALRALPAMTIVDTW